MGLLPTFTKLSATQSLLLKPCGVAVVMVTVLPDSVAEVMDTPVPTVFRAFWRLAVSVTPVASPLAAGAVRQRPSRAAKLKNSVGAASGKTRDSRLFTCNRVRSRRGGRRRAGGGFRKRS